MKFPKESATFARCPAGAFPAICQRIIDLGTHDETYRGKHCQRRKVRLEWQVTGELDDEGHPFVVGAEYTFSRDERSKLRKHLESWRGASFSEEQIETFTLESVLGASCLLQIRINDAGYPTIDSVGRLPKGTVAEPLVGPTVLFSLEPAEFDASLIEKFPDWIRSKIIASPEYADVIGGEYDDAGSSAGDAVGDDIPF